MGGEIQAAIDWRATREQAMPHGNAIRALEYDVVLATRNRPEALALSVPLLLAQTRAPKRLIVIDSSDAHGTVATVVRRAAAGWAGDLIIRRSPPGLPTQRNHGLRLAGSPIVFFLDDDSLLYPDAAEEILAIYEKDTNGRITGVCAAEATAPPDSANLGAGYAMSPAHRREARLRRMRNGVERRLTGLKPAMHLGRRLNARHGVPDWLAERNAVVVEYMTGFRMTFRMDAIRAGGFDEALAGYALDEDVDASFTAARSGLVVGAQKARIYHHRCPGGRGDDFVRGRMEVLNRAYVLLKHATGAAGSPALAVSVWKRQAAFMTLKLVALAPRVVTQSGRARFAGAWSGRRQALRLWSAGPGDRAAIMAGADPPRPGSTVSAVAGA